MNRWDVSIITMVFVMAIGILFSTDFLRAQVQLGKDGQPSATIVHHGHKEHAETLQKFLKKISGAEPGLKKNGGDGSTISLRVVDELEGTSDRRTADHAYRLRTDGDTLHLRAQTDLGLEYAVYGLLQDHLGVGFFSGDFTRVPDRPGLQRREPESGGGSPRYDRRQSGQSPLRRSNPWVDDWVQTGFRVVNQC